MRSQSLTALACAAGLLALAAPGARTARAEDLDQMQGTWRVVSAQVGGAVAGSKDLKKMRVSIDGHKLILDEGTRVYTVHFALDPTASPHQVDFFKDMGRKQKLWDGLYEFDGKDLKLCWGAEGAERPKEFGVQKGTEQRYFIISPK
jgi:uncharacterized protein (TIGR03067 family)